MGRKSEIDEDDAAKAVTSSLRQATAHSRDDSFARRRGTTSDLAGAPGDENHRPKAQEPTKTKGTLSHAPGDFLGNEESKEEIEPIMSNGGGSEKAMNEKEEKVCTSEKYFTARSRVKG